MSSRIARLIESYQRHIALPWQIGLAGVQKVIFVVYDKTDELRMRYQVGEFENATLSAGHKWVLVDITDDFPQWMAGQEYREGFFEHPEDLQDILGEFTASVVAKIDEHLAPADDDTVVALQGVAGLYGFTHTSEVVAAIANNIPGRLLVFFPGEYDQNNYRLLDARPGWNYQAVPITAGDAL
tara:strand:- start:575 stop:1123 length:549 start_codon:yes stop_codon:yes gene_type:complete